MQDDVIVSGVAQTISVNANQSASFSLSINNYEPLVTIRPDGKIEYGPNYTPDEAAKTMWRAFGYHRALYEAAPEMLAIIEGFMSHYARGDTDPKLWDRATAVLAKVTGQQS